jgi:hypothetical protein
MRGRGVIGQTPSSWTGLPRHVPGARPTIGAGGNICANLPFWIRRVDGDFSHGPSAHGAEWESFPLTAWAGDSGGVRGRLLIPNAGPEFPLAAAPPPSPVPRRTDRSRSGRRSLRRGAVRASSYGL